VGKNLCNCERKVQIRGEMRVQWGSTTVRNRKEMTKRVTLLQNWGGLVSSGATRGKKTRKVWGQKRSN